MLIVINIGNTRILCASVIEEQVKSKVYFYTHSEISQLKKFLSKCNKEESLQGIIISSVVQNATKIVAEFIESNLNIEPLIVKYSHLRDILKLDVDNPKNLSSDRIGNIIGAQKHYGKGLIIVDMGTATIFDVVDHSGVYIGGVITPGMLSQFDTLSSNTMLVPEAEKISKPNKLIAKNTINAIKSGIFWGYICMVEGIVARIQENTNQPLKVVATGGVLSLVLDEITKIDYKDSDLLIKGLIEIYRLIGKKYDPKLK
ncbi:MAG: coaX [Rickettsiaceae bacterium]|jgi:type III pantothenate kinase|nr:coaX [Rickettsiaceae bacterium]